MKNKKKFGLPMLALVVGMVLVGGSAIGALVSYLGNSATATTTVNSPLEIEVRNDAGATWTDTISLSVFGGDKASFEMKEQNFASVPITSALTYVVSEPGQDLLCAEITAFDIKEGANPAVNLVGSCVVDSSGANDVLVFNKPLHSITATTVVEWDVDITFAPAALGDYQVIAQHLI